MSAVSIVNAKEFNNIEQVIKKSLNLIGYSFPKNIKKVVIKPNMCYYWDYSTGYTTDPLFVKSLISVIQEALPNAQISIIESDASAMKCKYAFKVLGYDKIAKETNVNLINLTEEKAKNKVDIKIADLNFSILVPEVIEEAELRVNVPKPKFMNQVTITCALKNIFGCNPEPLKYKLHSGLAEAIVAINEAMKFNLALLDGIIVVGSSTKRINLVMASEDMVAFDATVAELMGENPKHIQHIQMAEQVGLGKTKHALVGSDLSVFKKAFPKQSTSSKVLAIGYKTAVKSGIIKTDLL